MRSRGRPRAGDTSAPLVGWNYACSICSLRLSSKHQARCLQCSVTEHADELVVPRAALGSSAGHYLVGAVLWRGCQLAVPPPSRAISRHEWRRPRLNEGSALSERCDLNSLPPQLFLKSLATRVATLLGSRRAGGHMQHVAAEGAKPPSFLSHLFSDRRIARDARARLRVGHSLSSSSTLRSRPGSLRRRCRSRRSA